ncbi:hypothetical protein [Coleofasciculus sp. G2-EDA-02]|uniref:hypothetical protein n=1 Tax=Coleofasciculus sp. G2-EDA-02 TaxID=3069529 RepID=UPI003301F48D
MSWKQVRVFVLALIFGAVLVVLLKVILATLAEKGQGKSAARLPKVESSLPPSVETRHGTDTPWQDAPWHVSTYIRTTHKERELISRGREKEIIY